MASVTSPHAPVKVSEKQGKASSKSVQNYYKTQVTTLGDGGVMRETYRTDAKGNTISKIQEVVVDKDGKQTKNEILSTATEGEKKALNDPNSQLRTSIKNQTEKAADSDQIKNNIDGVDSDTVKKAGGGSGNDAENDNDNNQTKPAAATGDSIKELANATDESSEGTRTQFPTLVHPTGLGKSKQDVIRFDMMEYMPQQFINASTGALGFSNAGRQDFRSRSIGSVTLPIPSGISDQNNADWGSQSMTALDIFKADLAVSTLGEAAKGGNAGEAFANTAQGYLDFVRKQPGALKTATVNAFAAAASGVEGQQLLSRTTGMVMNPNMELLFKGPTLRPFSFKFTLAPRDKDEAKTIVSIIRFFKQGMAPIRTKANLFLKSPNTFKVTYLHRGESGKEHFGLNKFKECALLGLNVDYTPNANYATFTDGTMVAYRLTMRFQELEPVFNDDYQNEQNSIGF